MSEDGYLGFADQFTDRTEYGALSFLVRMLMGEMATAALVQVQAVYPDEGPLGAVDVLPLVSQIDGRGQATPHGTLFGLPYFRPQGGSSAVILTPEPGDIGLALFASRDISSVKATQAAAPPGSLRQYDMADGLYLGGFLNPAATQYMRMAGGIEFASPVVSTDRTLVAGNGATGSFSTSTGQVVTVMNGIVIEIS